jgi:hypothetical protein
MTVKTKTRGSEHLGDGGNRVSAVLHLPEGRLLDRGRVVGHNSELLEERKLSSTIERSDGEDLAKVRK